MSYPPLPDNVDLRMAIPPSSGNSFPLIRPPPRAQSPPPIPDGQLFFTYPIPETPTVYGSRNANPCVAEEPTLPSIHCRVPRRKKAIGSYNPARRTVSSSNQFIHGVSSTRVISNTVMGSELCNVGIVDIISSLHSISDNQRIRPILNFENNNSSTTNLPNLPVGHHLNEITESIDRFEVSDVGSNHIPLNNDVWEIGDFSYEGLLELGSLSVKDGLSKDLLSRIPKCIMTIDDTGMQETECSICLEPFKIGCHYSQLICAHIFHYQCLGEALKKMSSCPLCRRRVFY